MGKLSGAYYHVPGDPSTNRCTYTIIIRDLQKNNKKRKQNCSKKFNEHNKTPSWAERIQQYDNIQTRVCIYIHKYIAHILHVWYIRCPFLRRFNVRRLYVIYYNNNNEVIIPGG